MRTIHRLLAIVTVALMLYLGVTGTLMQLLDMYALATHAALDAENVDVRCVGSYD